MLDDGLDQERCLGELIEIGDDLDAPGVQALLGELGARLFDRRPRALGRAGRARPQEHLALSSTGHRQPARDRAGPGDS